jgi:hypothetical protein
MTEGDAGCLWAAAGKDKEHMYRDTTSLFSDGLVGRETSLKSGSMKESHVIRSGPQAGVCHKFQISLESEIDLRLWREDSMTDIVVVIEAAPRVQWFRKNHGNNEI